VELAITETETETDALHTVVASYLSTLLAISDCVGTACPETGGPYRHRLNRLRSRLAFDASPEALTESAAVVDRELKEYSTKTANYVAMHSAEMRSTIAVLESIVKSLAQRQHFYGERLLQFAAQMEITDADGVALQSAGLQGCVESMNHDAQSMLDHMRDQLVTVVERLQEAEVTDRVTGLMNRQEMQRQIDLRKAAGQDPVIVVFELSGDVRDEIAQQVAARLGSQFRHQDMICRWTEFEFLILFQGSRETAQARTAQIVPWIAGRYPLENGEVIDITADAGIVSLKHLAMY
jgi:GGDEF domain-containing protein